MDAKPEPRRPLLASPPRSHIYACFREYEYVNYRRTTTQEWPFRTSNHHSKISQSNLHAYFYDTLLRVSHSLHISFGSRTLGDTKSKKNCNTEIFFHNNVFRAKDTSDVPSRRRQYATVGRNSRIFRNDWRMFCRSRKQNTRSQQVIKKQVRSKCWQIRE